MNSSYTLPVSKNSNNPIFDFCMRISFRYQKKCLSINTLGFIVNLLLFTFTYNFALAQDSFEPYTVEVEEPIDMVAVEGGTMLLGSDGNSEEVEVQVDSFWMGKYEITWQQYEEFSRDVMSDLTEQNLPGAEIGVDADVISLPSPPYVDMSFGMGSDGYPAISMTHYAASMFTKWLTAKTGEFYRLPTEAEWEYACRGGTNESGEDLMPQAWHARNIEGGYQKIGTKEPNSLGIFDLAGNVAEWTTDQYFEDYYEKVKELGDEPIDNPWFKPTELYRRAVRGASWMDDESEVSCTKRRASSPNWKMLDPQLPRSLWWHTSAQFLGFRIVRPVNQPSPEEMKKYWPEEIQDY